MKRLKIIAILLFALSVRGMAQMTTAAPSARADTIGRDDGDVRQQHQHEQKPTQTATPSQEHAGHDMSQMDMQHMGHDHEAESPAEVMELGFTSGTSWQAQSAPEHMWMRKWRDWQLMAHGNLFITFNHQGGPRGAGKAESENWLMFMEERKLGRGTLQMRQMLSAEPLTAPHPGFPELFQTGETYHGVPLVDHQHPHDVFGEIAAKYVLPIGERVTWTLYGGPAGEPALGPTAFLHRNSAAEIPEAPLGHHLQDSTHISFGVVTTGLTYKMVKVEGSVFNGREPDERRYNFDFGSMDSYSGRVSFSPNKNWAAQYSVGRLIHPEALEPGDLVRQTASVNYSRPMSNGNWATTLVWGRNHKIATQTDQNSYLLESSLNFLKKNYAFTRVELVDKDELFPEGGGPAGYNSFRIGAYTFGGVRDLVQSKHWQVGLGADFSVYSKPSVLNAYYGEHPVGFHVFLRIRPGKMTH
jgi:hypothetical protein